jgi:hypothetical protein
MLLFLKGGSAASSIYEISGHSGKAGKKLDRLSAYLFPENMSEIFALAS